MVLLLALVFQKNPAWGIFVLGIYVLYRFRSRKFNSNKGLISSGEKNTEDIVIAITTGFETIAEVMKAEDTEIYYDNDKNRTQKKRGYYNKTPESANLLQN